MPKSIDAHPANWRVSDVKVKRQSDRVTSETSRNHSQACRRTIYTDFALPYHRGRAATTNASQSRIALARRSAMGIHARQLPVHIEKHILQRQVSTPAGYGNP